jgi:hypothetical protein
MKSILKSNLEALLAILLFPQIFVLLYFLIPTIKGAEGFSMIKHLLNLGFSISRVGAPVLYMLYWAITTLNQNQRRAGISFLICSVTGYLSLIAWNHYIFQNFSYGWGLLTVLLCSGGVGFYHYFKDPNHHAPRKQELFLSSDA